MPDDSLIRGTRVGPSPNTVYRSSSDAIVVDTTAETDIFIYTVPAFTLDGDHGIRVTLDGVIQNASGGSVQYVFRVYLGATVLWSDAASFGTGTVAPANLSLAVHAKDSDAIQELFGTIALAGTGTPAAGEGDFNTLGFSAPIYGDATEDATGPLDFRVTVDMDTADPDASFTLRRALVEEI